MYTDHKLYIPKVFANDALGTHMYKSIDMYPGFPTLKLPS